MLTSSHITRVEGELGISIVSIAEPEFGVVVTTDDVKRAQRLARLITANLDDVSHLNDLIEIVQA